MVSGSFWSRSVAMVQIPFLSVRQPSVKSVVWTSLQNVFASSLPFLTISPSCSSTTRLLFRWFESSGLSRGIKTRPLVNVPAQCVSDAHRVFSVRSFT